MRKFATTAMCFAIVASVLTGCGKTTNEKVNDVVKDEVQVEEPTSEGTSAEETTNESEITVEVPTEEDVTIKVSTLKGPTAMGMVQLMEESKESEDYTFSIAGSADEITPLLIKGDIDIAAVPANLASVLYNNTEGAIDVIAINTLGVIYIVENGNSITSFTDLKGKTIYASGKGSTPEYALNYLLTMNGIDPEKDVTIEWKSEHAECVAALATADEAIAMLPQPFVTTAQLKNDKIRIALDMTAEWDAIQKDSESASTLITGVLVARKDFLDSYPIQVSEFLDAYEGSVDFVNNNTEEAAAYIEGFDIVPAAVAKKALPFCNITFIEGLEMKEKLSGYLNVLFEANPKAVGGKLPNEDFYYIR